jgi:uncharacterized protein (DUF2141 family)
MRKFILILTLALFATPLLASDVEIEITGFRNAKGTVWVGLYNTAESFPDQGKVYNEKFAKIVDGKVSVTFENVPDGTYAFVSYHDENDNKILDMSPMGPPAEGLVSSQGAIAYYGPPKFSDAKFELKGLHKESAVIKY